MKHYGIVHLYRGKIGYLVVRTMSSASLTAERVTVVVLCVYVCVCVCLSAHAILAVRAIKSVTKDTVVLRHNK